MRPSAIIDLLRQLKDDTQLVWPELKSLRRLLEIVREYLNFVALLFREEALVITTHWRGAGEGSSDSVSDGVPFLQTVLQPDGDLVTRVHPACTSQAETWNLHLETVRQRLASFRVVPAFFRVLLSAVYLVVAPLTWYWKDGSWIGALFYFIGPPLLIFALQQVRKWLLPPVKHFVLRRLPVMLKRLSAKWGFSS